MSEPCPLESDPMTWPEPSLHAQIAWRMSASARDARCRAALAYVPSPAPPHVPPPDNTLWLIAWSLVLAPAACAFAPGLMPIIILGIIVLLVLA